MNDDTQDSPLQQEARLWQDDHWTAQVIKNEDDDGWAVAMFKAFNPGAMFPARAAKVASGPFEPASFTASMARKDVRLMIEEAARGGVELTVMPAVAKRYDEAIAAGEASLDCAAPFRWPLE